MSIILCVIIATICFTVGIFIGVMAATAKRVGYMEITDTDTKTNYNLIVTVPIDDLGKYKVVAFIVKHTRDDVGGSEPGFATKTRP